MRDKLSGLLRDAGRSFFARAVKTPWRAQARGDNLIVVVLAVLATKIRTSGDGSLNATVGKAYNGFLISEPVVGRGMVLFRDPNGRRMVTTPVRRVLTTAERELLYVETENSVYRISVIGDYAEQASAAS